MVRPSVVESSSTTAPICEYEEVPIEFCQVDPPAPGRCAVFLQEAGEVEGGCQGALYFVLGIVAYIVSAVPFVCIWLLTFAAGVFLLVLGATNISSCPVNRYVPIWLIIHGVCLVVVAALGCWHILVVQLAHRGKELPQRRIRLQCGGLQLTEPMRRHYARVGATAFMFCFGTGAALLQLPVSPSPNPHDRLRYCDQLAYSTVWWTIVLTSVLVGVLLIVLCLGTAFVFVYSRRRASRMSEHVAAAHDDAFEL